MCEEMRTLVSRFAEYLRRSEQQLRCFPQCESQVEGWFKGELLCFLDREKLEGRLPDFEREKKLYVGDERNRIQVDMMLQFDQPGGNRRSKWVELKHWIGYQNNTLYKPSWYFTTTSHDCCVKAVLDRLLTIPEDGDKFMLVPFTPNPRFEKWNSGVEAFNAEFSHLSVRSLTNPNDYPEYFFLGLLHVPED